MKLILRTQVARPLPEVWAGFDRTLFDKLSPPFPPVDVIRFDGCLTGDQVQLELNFLLFKQRWDSLIVDQQSTPDEIFFIDEGTRLPFFLRYWRHRHRLVRSGNGTVIIDDITFRTPSRFTDFLMLPILWLQFLYRKPVYKHVFN
ncbi:SRPBCC family protein [Arsenicibacter rosenii]|uniref:Ligand-binding SRPBCC domain-containing protein n=1 Tax=Arsenicibacter rosenii TaxID=1750698 RepID=A0A1S2VD27_9BACT|nr:hypothetical protein [Arsenicibacter rosenii]OIN56589.1 hypothetical protein BLX24_24290 [Arsenicibacter rosenii]